MAWILSHLLQDALVEELLQFLVAVVDAELLEAVVFKVLCEKEREPGDQVRGKDLSSDINRTIQSV